VGKVVWGKDVEKGRARDGKKGVWLSRGLLEGKLDSVFVSRDTVYIHLLYILVIIATKWFIGVHSRRKGFGVKIKSKNVMRSYVDFLVLVRSHT
jgi:hypothetical protein